MVGNYFETGYRFIDNVRFFKANDPYFYKVDNIPIKQLDENVKFLKDQTDGLLKQVSKKATLGREGFTELQPYSDAVDSIVKVRPGRFSARINDAYSIDPEQFITQILGLNNIDLDNVRTWRFQTVNGVELGVVFDKFKAKSAANATSMNGLFERSFVFPVTSKDIPGDYIETSDPRTLGTADFDNWAPVPGFTSNIPLHNTNLTTRDIAAFTTNLDGRFRSGGRLESEFIRAWKGVTRTSIVDVPDELSIEIPPFDQEDFFYINSDGVKTLSTSTQRIDLLFIYTKAVDQSDTTLPSYVAGAPKIITEPILGIVKGAGVGVDLTSSPDNTNRVDGITIQDSDGVPRMLPNVSDELQENTGFSTSAGVIRGSFPSPDDLMNLAPLLSEQLSKDSIALIGQSVLPVAYIVVKETVTTNSAGKAIITSDDIIDIRPLMRTTELAYNERAGIAAAIPQVSIANPVVTEDYMEEFRRNVVTDYSQKLNVATQSLAQNASRIIGAGSIKGGMYYGVEGALGTYIRDIHNATEYTEAKLLVETRFGYPVGSIPDLPDWDLATWTRNSGESSLGQLPNDRINYHQFGMSVVPGAANAPLSFGPFSTAPATAAGIPVFDNTNPRIGALGTDTLVGTGDNINNIGNAKGANCQYFVSKTIQLDRTQTQWATDYNVSVQLWNCVPMSCRTGMNHNGRRYTSTASTSDIWVDKKENSFTIFVSWVADDPLEQAGGELHNEYQKERVPFNNRNDGGKYAGFSVINTDIMNTAYANSTAEAPSVAAGVAIYPTVTFQIFGITQEIQTAGNNLNNNNPTITLR